MAFFEFHFSVLFAKVILDLVLISIYVNNVGYIYIRQCQPGLTLIILCCLSIYGIVGYIFNSDLYHKRLPCEIENTVTVLLITICSFCGCLKLIHMVADFSQDDVQKSWLDKLIKLAALNLLPSTHQNNLDINIENLILKYKARKLRLLTIGLAYCIISVAIMVGLQNTWVTDKYINNRWCKNLEPALVSNLLSVLLLFVLIKKLKQLDRGKDAFFLLPQTWSKAIVMSLYSVLGGLDWYYRYAYNDYLISPVIFLLLSSAIIANSSVFQILYHYLYGKKVSIYRFDFSWNNYELRKQMMQICKQAFVVQYMYFLYDTSPEFLYNYSQKDLKKLTVKYFNADSPYYIELDYFLVWHLRQEQVEISGLVNVRKALISIIKDEVLPYLTLAPVRNKSFDMYFFFFALIPNETS